MTRIVIDTNVLVSAVVFGGKPMQALQLVEALGIELTISNELECELSETLTGKFGWASQQVTDVCDRLFRNASRIKPIPRKGIVRDAGDDHVLALAIASGASLIVTGDKDLLSLGSYRGIDIVTPIEIHRAGHPWISTMTSRNRRLSMIFGNSGYQPAVCISGSWGPGRQRV